MLLAVLIGGALWMLFPKQDLERRLSVTGDDSELSYNYLSNLLKSDPGNENLRALLKAKEERLKAIKLAREEAAKQALPSAAVQAWERWQAAYQNYLEAQKQDHRAGGQADALGLQVMQALKEVPLAGLTQEQALYLASSALVLKDAPLALGIYDDVAARQGDPARKAQVYESAARQALGMSLYEESARLLRQASATTDDVPQSRAYLWQALQVLQSGNRASEALALARQQEELLGSDPETLRRLIGLARAAGNRAEAERYAKRLLQLSLLQQWQVQVAGASGAGPAVASAVADDGAWALQPVAWTARAGACCARPTPHASRRRACHLTTRPTSWATRCSSKTATWKMPGAWPRLRCARRRRTWPGASAWPRCPNGWGSSSRPWTTGWSLRRTRAVKMPGRR